MGSDRLTSAAVAERQPAVLPQEQTRSKPKFLQLSNRTKVQLKLGLSLAMFVGLFAFGKVDLSKSWEVATKANLWFLSGAALLYLSSVVLNAHRWQILAAAVGFERPLKQLTQYCFVGLFFNLFLPSTVGGDFSRCYYLSKGTGRYHQALYSVLADRVVGIAVLFLFASVGLLVGPGGAGLPWHLKLPIFGGAAAIFGLIPFMPVLTMKLLGPQNKIAQRFNNSVVQVYWRDRGLIAFSLFLSIVMQLILVICHVLIGLALGLNNVPLWYYFVFYPSVAVLGFVTPSFNGIGIREWAYTYFLTMCGVDRSHALTYAVMWFGLITLTCLLGGVVYIAGHLQISREERETMQLDAV